MKISPTVIVNTREQDPFVFESLPNEAAAVCDLVQRGGSRKKPGVLP